MSGFAPRTARSSERGGHQDRDGWLGLAPDSHASARRRGVQLRGEVIGRLQGYDELPRSSRDAADALGEIISTAHVHRVRTTPPGPTLRLRKVPQAATKSGSGPWLARPS